jgi:hypothetical protein
MALTTYDLLECKNMQYEVGLHEFYMVLVTACNCKYITDY